MFVCTSCGYKFFMFSGGLPDWYHELYRPYGQLVDEKNLDLLERDSTGNSICFLAVQKKGCRDYALVITAGYDPADPFLPEMLFVAETNTLYLGAGEHVMTYCVNPPAKIAEEEADLGFLGWDRVQDVVIMTAEMGIAVWDLTGNRLWFQTVDHPYEYVVNDDIMDLTAFSQHFFFPLRSGPTRNIMTFRPGRIDVE